MIARLLVLLAVGFATLALGAPATFAASVATPYDFLRLESFDPQSGGRFADRMKSAGDLNGDGVGDVWIAAYSHDVGGLLNVGRIWAMSGKTRSVLYVIDNPEPQSCTGFACGLGWNLSNLGDVDGDGVSDLAAAANRQNVTDAGDSCTAGAAGCNASQGRAYVFSGAPGKPRTPLYKLDNPDLPDAQGGAQAGGNFGWASTAGDVVKADGSQGKDGISEVLVGAFQNDFPAGCGNVSPVLSGCRKDQGQAFIFNGAPTLPGGTPRLVRTLDVPAEDRYMDPATNTCVSASQRPTEQQCGGLGIVSEGVGDVNGDGYWDQSGTAWTTGITQPGGQPCRGTSAEVADGCNERQGRIYVYSGKDGSVLRKVDDPVPQQGALFGLQIVQAGAPGDVNGDGFNDIYGNGFQQNGRAWVLSGKDGSVLLDLQDPTPEVGGTYGYSLEKTDYDRDGSPDLYLGSFAGSYVVSGKTGSVFKTFDLPPGDEAGQVSGNTNLGRSVAAPGDLNGDCEPDFVSGSPGHDIGSTLDQGRAYVYLSGGPSSCPSVVRPPPLNPAPSAPAPSRCGKTINGTPGRDTLSGTPCADVINAGAGNDVVNGGGGNDVIISGSGNDVVNAGSGNDRVDGGSGNDRINGGTGNDSLKGGDGNDTVSGNEGNDVITGGSGNDRLAGNEGNDRINGNRGNDRLSGNSGKDRLSGSTGRDVIGGGSGNDRLNGNSGNDRLSGNSGSDRLTGGSGSDRLTGGSGVDRLNGNSGNDRLSGNSGSDRLTGGSGVDRLSGNSGNDRIGARDQRRERVECGSGRDRVIADRIDRIARNCERVSRRGG